jgi:hypothetical protein
MSDATVLSALCRWIDFPDCVLSDLCRRFLNRDGFKSIALSPKKVSLVSDTRSEQIRDYMESLSSWYSQSVESYVLYDEGGIDAYFPYKWGSTKDHPPILVRADGVPEDIADVLPRLQAITEEGVFERYYCPAECRDRIAAILND